MEEPTGEIEGQWWGLRKNGKLHIKIRIAINSLGNAGVFHHAHQVGQYGYKELSDLQPQLLSICATHTHATKT